MQKEIERWITSPDTDTALPSPTVAAAQLHHYSYLPCRKKKRKCDRTYPCVNCRATGLECLFVPRRTPTRQPVSVGLSARIQYLELIIGQLRQHYIPVSLNTIFDGCLQQLMNLQLDLPQNFESGRYVTDTISELDTEFGRLALEGGRSRYVSANFWANLNEEVSIRRVELNSWIGFWCYSVRLMIYRAYYTTNSRTQTFLGPIHNLILTRWTMPFFQEFILVKRYLVFCRCPSRKL